MANNQVMTAPFAIIKVDGNIIGKMKNIRASETYRRGRVIGVGRMNASEVPALEFTGTLNCSFYTLDFKEHPLLLKALLRKTGTTNKLLNTVALQEIGLKIDIIRTVADKVTFPPEGRDANGIINTIDEIFATIEEAFITSDGFDLNEGQISGRDCTFEYLDPIAYAVGS